MARLSLLRHGPAQFQSFIPGENVRVHTIGDQLFATRVRSEAVDYRYASREGRNVEMEPRYYHRLSQSRAYGSRASSAYC